MYSSSALTVQLEDYNVATLCLRFNPLCYLVYISCVKLQILMQICQNAKALLQISHTYLRLCVALWPFLLRGHGGVMHFNTLNEPLHLEKWLVSPPRRQHFANSCTQHFSPHKQDEECYKLVNRDSFLLRIGYPTSRIGHCDCKNIAKSERG